MRSFFGAVGDRIVVDGGEAVRRLLIWPIQDRLFEYPGRVLALGMAVVLVAAAGAAALLLGTPTTSSAPTTAETATPSKPVAVVKAPPKQLAPTLHGAKPVFKPGKGKPSAVNSAEAIESAPAKSAAGSSSSAASATVSSNPSAGASALESRPGGPPAGPAAIAVAREFATAFVVYETGGEKSAVRKTLGKTATPELSRSLLRRPPRLPAGGRVPKAKVLNVVPGPSQGRVYSVSVSLLRVGVTSELRLDMERLKNDGWRVTNVLG